MAVPLVLLCLAVWLNLPVSDVGVSPSSYITTLNTLHTSSKPYYSRVAIGFNSCVDLIVRASDVLETLGIKEISANQVLHDNLNTLNEFAETFSYGFIHGSAAERFIEDKDLCKKIIDTAKASKTRTIHTGGNAALMGLRFASGGAKVLLAGAVGELAQQLLDKAHNPIQLSSNQEPVDEVHLIMEYGAEENFGGLVAPRANRFIVHCDHTSSKLSALEFLAADHPKFEPELIVLAGLHMLEREPLEFRTRRLEEVATYISSIGADVPVHLELASVASDAFLKEILFKVAVNVNSIGLNEQELGHVYHVLKKENSVKDLSKFEKPPVALVVEAISLIFTELRKDNNQLGRIHFHSLEYHMVAVKGSSGWASGKESVVAGSLDTSLKSCNIPIPFSEEDLLEKFKLPFVEDNMWVMPHDVIKQTETQPIGLRHWIDRTYDIDYSLASVGVCKAPRKTVGLGDIISATGLLHHQFGTSAYN